MKKVLALVLVLVLSLGLFAGCGGAKDSKDLPISHFVWNFSDPQQGLVKTECEKIYKAEGYDVSFYDGGGTQATQTDQITTAIQMGTSMLVCGVKDVEAAQAVVDFARDADIPLVFYNNQPESKIINSYDRCWFVGTDPRGGGDMQGEMAANFIINNDFDKWDRDGDGYISYVIIRANLASAEATGRTQGCVIVANETLQAAGYKGLKQIVPDDNAYLGENWSTSEGNDLMSNFLTAFPVTETSGVELVMCNNDGLALGAMTALNAKGWNMGGYDNKFIPLVGVDATADAKAAIDNQKMLGSAAQSAPLMATYVTTVAFGAYAGKEDVLEGSGLSFEAAPDAKKLLMPYSPYPNDFTAPVESL